MENFSKFDISKKKEYLEIAQIKAMFDYNEKRFYLYEKTLKCMRDSFNMYKNTLEKEKKEDFPVYYDSNDNSLKEKTEL